MDDDEVRGGTGPLYEHTPAGEQAAREEVHIPGSNRDVAGATDEEGREEGDDQDDDDIMTDADLPSGG